MATEYEFTAGQLNAMYQALVVGTAQNLKDHEQRAWLMGRCEFTAEEKAGPDLEYESILGAVGEPDQTRFEPSAKLTRAFTARQRKKLIEACLGTVTVFRSGWLERWLKPALIVLGHKFKEPNWEADDE